MVCQWAAKTRDAQGMLRRPPQTVRSLSQHSRSRETQSVIEGSPPSCRGPAAQAHNTATGRNDLAALRANIKIKMIISPRIRAGIGPQSLMSFGK